MVPNRISDTLLPETRDEILEYISTVQELMPFLIGLTPSERQRLPKAGDRSQGFIRKALDVGQHIPDYLPRAIDLDEMRKDVALGDSLYPVMLAVSQLAEKLADTYAVITSEAYASALVIYRNAKHAKGEEGLEQAMAELSRRFARRAPAATPEASPDANSDSAS